MPTIDERIALLEERVGRLAEALDGGPHVPWDHSIRGRIHAMRSELDAARLARQALDEVRRSQRREWTHRERVLALLFAGIATVTPYVLLAIHWHS